MKCKFFTLLFAFAFSLPNLFSQTDFVYGLNFINSDIGVAFSRMDLSDGSVEILSDGPISLDMISHGVADFDPISKSYFYINYENEVTNLYRVDALTGTIIFQQELPSDNLVTSLTNIAYNWLDNKLYGVSHSWNGVNDILKIVVFDFETNELSFINSNPIYTGSYLSGNSDIDPIHRKYYFATAQDIVTVDLNTGESTVLPLNFDNSYNNIQFFNNLTYNWLDQKIYGLHFLSIPDDNIFDENYYTSELRLGTVDPSTGIVEIISEEKLSYDGFSQGDSDIDPTNNRYFYIRQNEMHIVDLASGDLLDLIPIENELNSVAPIMNMSYDDLLVQPEPLNMIMPETFELAVGETMDLNVWVGNDVNYLWNDGSTEAVRSIAEAGEYSVQIQKAGFTIEASTSVQAISSANDLNDENKSLTVFPNPAKDLLSYTLDSIESSIIIDACLMDFTGKEIKKFDLIELAGTIDVSELPSGNYLFQLRTTTETLQQKIVIE